MTTAKTISRILHESSVYTAIHLLALALLLYISSIGIKEPLLALPFVLFFLYGVIVDQRMLQNAYFWLGASVLFAINIAVDWYTPANHHFLANYLCLVLFLAFLQPREEQEAFIANNFRWVTAILFFFVTFQKIMSPSYMDGSFFGYMIAHGGFLDLFQGIIPGFQELIDANAKNILNFSDINPRVQTAIDLVVADGSHFAFYSKGLAYLVIGGELLTFLSFLLFKEGKIRHILLIMTIFGVLFTRAEGGFLSLLCVLGFLQCTPDAKMFKPLYLALFMILCGLLVINYVYI
ncbi:MAG: hypothetical protein R2828_19235 [Saprospiraceae bacterium]